MQLTPRQIVTQFAHLLQEELFPLLQTVTGPLSRQMELLTSVVALAPLERMLSARRSGTGRPAKDRAALATAFPSFGFYFALSFQSLPSFCCPFLRFRM